MHDSTTRNAAVIVELMNQALAAPDVPNAVTPLLEQLVSDTAAVGAGYFQRDGHLFHARAASGDMPEDEQFTAVLAHGLPEDLPLLAQLKERSEPLFFSDTAADGRVEAFASFGVKSLAAAPVHSTGGDFLGSFLMHTFEQHRWNEGESALFASLAGALAGLTARLIAEEDAKSAREGAMRALGLALEARDRETKGHTDRVDGHARPYRGGSPVCIRAGISPGAESWTGASPPRALGRKRLSRPSVTIGRADFRPPLRRL